MRTPVTILPGQARFELEGIHSLWEWIEANGEIAYPAIAVAVIGLVLGALIFAGSSDYMSATRRAQYKAKILHVLQHRVGASAEAIAAELQLDLLPTARLLAELEEEHLIASTDGGNPTAPVQWRLRRRS